MNYRHHFHAGNFADVSKHVILLELVRGMQRKSKGFFYLDTHAGRGAYDLMVASQGDTLAREPEWPAGIGRIASAADRPEPVERYWHAVRQFRQELEHDTMYPGSPALAGPLLRPQDRALFCELHPEEHGLLEQACATQRRIRVESRDGFEAVRGSLPPREKRALVLIDPPYEDRDDSANVLAALREGLRRLPAGTFAIWYPLTRRAGAPTFLEAVAADGFPPTWTAELTVAGPESELSMRGAGVMVINPPWQLDRELDPVMTWLGARLAQAPGGRGELRWLVPEI